MQEEGVAMDDELKALIEHVRNYEMTDDEIVEQRVSYAFGNTLADDGISRDEVRRAVTNGVFE